VERIKVSYLIIRTTRTRVYFYLPQSFCWFAWAVKIPTPRISPKAICYH
jgi:hypothetical protein